jgi:hypothetical protein
MDFEVTISENSTEEQEKNGLVTGVLSQVSVKFHLRGVKPAANPDQPENENLLG